MEQQVIYIHDAAEPSAEVKITVKGSTPNPIFQSFPVGVVSLLEGLFRDRRGLTRSYVDRLQTANILQNHYLEAGVRIDRPYEEMHQGWESPHCQLRGHFAGHWLSAIAHFAARDHDPRLLARVAEAVEELKLCQEMNNGLWIGSIPRRFYEFLEERKPVWSPQYTVHKTMMGLLDAYLFTGNKDALVILEHSADWIDAWSDRLVKEGRSDAVYGGECAGMLELWADLYAVTGKEKYLSLASRYGMPDLFRQLLKGEDPLTNNHANASIPWINGAARVYEVTGDTRYRVIVEKFWEQGVERRGMFATTGNNAGEYWIPQGQFGRFLGEKTQEHCTVYNMIRVANYLLRWTGEAKYADYIERALYNGILAQQNPHTGAVCYFLPLLAGGKKKWGSETRDFWCCHGTLVQAQATYEDLIYYRTSDGLAISQFIPSVILFGTGEESVKIILSTESDDQGGNFTRKDDVTVFTVGLQIESVRSVPWMLRIRQPSWAQEAGKVEVNGVQIKCVIGKDGFIAIPLEGASCRIKIGFSKRIVREFLPGDKNRFVFMDGPIVLAALTPQEPSATDDAQVVPQYEHQYVAGREWKAGSYFISSRQGAYSVKPLFEVADEEYSVHWRRDE